MISGVSFPIVPLLPALLLDTSYNNYDLNSKKIKSQARTMPHSAKDLHGTDTIFLSSWKSRVPLIQAYA